MEEQKPLTAADLGAVARLCRLPLADARAAALAPELGNILALMDVLDPENLADEPPAIGYRAQWEG